MFEGKTPNMAERGGGNLTSKIWQLETKRLKSIGTQAERLVLQLTQWSKSYAVEITAQSTLVAYFHSRTVVGERTVKAWFDEEVCYVEVNPAQPGEEERLREDILANLKKGFAVSREQKLLREKELTSLHMEGQCSQPKDKLALAEPPRKRRKILVESDVDSSEEDFRPSRKLSVESAKRSAREDPPLLRKPTGRIDLIDDDDGRKKTPIPDRQVDFVLFPDGTAQWDSDRKESIEQRLTELLDEWAEDKAQPHLDTKLLLKLRLNKWRKVHKKRWTHMQRMKAAHRK